MKHVRVHHTGRCQHCDVFLNELNQQQECTALQNSKMPFVTEFLKRNAEIYAQRNAVYKDNYLMVGRIMKAMFPEGLTLVTEEDHNKFHLFMLAIVKLSRYAVNYDKGHEPSVEDLIVYMAMVQSLDNKAAEEREKLGES